MEIILRPLIFLNPKNETLFGNFGQSGIETIKANQKAKDLEEMKTILIQNDQDKDLSEKIFKLEKQLKESNGKIEDINILEILKSTPMFRKNPE